MSIKMGNCLCGSVNYSFDSEPVVTAVCHCNHCQKQTGTSFSLVMGVSKANFDIKHSGSLKVFQDQGDSGLPVHRYFCSGCGSPIYTYAESSPEYVWVKTGTLEDRSNLNPQMQIWCDRRQPWLPLADIKIQFSKNPVMS